ncbi:MAG: restriction endonuclease [Nostoc sp. ChiSLP01]|nr:restriction endonuclease [Nostoc sp. CmiSLP01]MDZ8289503.1 restriction endonuclease [Nostoc sp. ChiSLP01]
MHTYASKYSNELNDEWIFEFDYNALAGTLTGSDVDWAIYQVINGEVIELNFYTDEIRWLKSVWKEAIKQVPKSRRYLTSLTVHDGRPFSPNDLRDLFTSPILAGIGPFSKVIDGEVVTFEQTENLCNDEEWIQLQKKLIQEDGIRIVLQRIRGTLRKNLGFRVEEIYYDGWLEDSIHAVEIEGADLFFKRLLATLRPDKKPLNLDSTRVYFQDITPDLLNSLLHDPQEIYRISPIVFEQLICERLDKMGFEVKRVGRHTYHKDGGIDIVAWPKITTFPFLMAVQAKHHQTPKKKTGSKDVRDFYGAIQQYPFNVGLLVTNTTFTPDAQWYAQNSKNLLRLKDTSNIQAWLEGRYLEKFEMRNMPDEIEVCPGVSITIPKFR